MVAAALAAAPAAAHPSRGIAVDFRGTVYFSDLVRIWRIDGTRLRLVHRNPGSHSHALALEPSGQVSWDESVYDPANGSYSESIWQLSGNRISRRFGPVQGPTRGLGLLRDRQGCTFRSDQAGRGGPILVHRLCPGLAPVRLFGSAAADRRLEPVLINDVGGVALSPTGEFAFRHGSTVRAIDGGGRVRVLASGLGDDNFGIAFDPAGHLLVAEHRNRRVIRIAGTQRQVVATSPPGWFPTGVTAGRGGVVVLEASDHRPGQAPRMQVRQVRADGRSRLLAQVTVP